MGRKRARVRESDDLEKNLVPSLYHYLTVPWAYKPGERGITRSQRSLVLVSQQGDNAFISFCGFYLMSFSGFLVLGWSGYE